MISKNRFLLCFLLWPFFCSVSFGQERSFDVFTGFSSLSVPVSWKFDAPSAVPSEDDVIDVGSRGMGARRIGISKGDYPGFAGFGAGMLDVEMVPKGL